MSKVITKNKKALFDYEIKNKYIAGVVLSGPEVKSIKQGHVQLKGAFATIDGEEVIIKNMYVASYPPAAQYQQHYDPYQNRTLLMKKQEISHLVGKTAEKGITLIPLAVLNQKGLIKIELGLGVGKKKSDKRESIKKREFDRNKQRLLKNSR